MSGFRSLGAASRLLVVNQFGINTGFYMVLPFLATYLIDDLGYGVALAGLVLGLRNLSMQGLFLVGGSAADRLGCRPMIVAGLALRVLAFGLLATTASLPGVITAVLLIGLAGALFNPAVRTYLTLANPGRRAEAFAVFNVAAHSGALAGPLLGVALLAVDFRVAALVACVLFGLLSLAQLAVLPALPVAPQDTTVLGSWRQVATNRRFLAFTLFGSAYFALYNQLYLALPVEGQRVTGSPAAVGAIFVVSTMIGITMQVRITGWCRTRMPPGTAVAAGIALMGAGFVPLLISAPLLPTVTTAPGLTAQLVAVLPVLAGTVVFTIGQAMANPFTMQLLPVIGDERLTGTYYGFFYLLSALVTAVVTAGVGALIDLPGDLARATPGLALLLLGVVGAAGIATLQRRGVLSERS